MALNAVDDGEGQRRHAEDGSPLIPALMVDGEVLNFQHPSQIASLLDLDVDVGEAAPGIAWGLLDVLQRWVDVIRDVPFEHLMTPTPSRGRTIRNLTVNVFRPIAVLPRTWYEQEFHWYTGEADLQQEAYLRSTEELVAFAQEAFVAFNSFLLEEGDALGEQDPRITGNRGEMPYSTLLATQRFHAAFHYRQIVDHLTRSGVDGKAPLPDAVVREIGLPSNLY